ncbi:M15 family metallopeptidase [Hyphomicrobium sp.]|uniref:M15 family metallopeptidase n=1 Tax=Hyphomicrobium sp. TaxID=82 RepID=UPI003F6EEAC6
MVRRHASCRVLGATSASVLGAVLAVAVVASPVHSEPGPQGAASDVTAGVARLIAAYPNHLEKAEGNWLVWRDGTRMALDDGGGTKSFADWLDHPDIEDMLRLAYPAGAGPLVPEPESDPGRARNTAFFDKMYGDCRKGEVAGSLDTITWLPKKAPQKLQVTRINGVAARLAAVSRALDALPASFDKYLIPSAGTYNCRAIAGTSRLSAHGSGIAIDIAVALTDYWRWGGTSSGGRVAYKNRIPLEIVHIFERHGFIWGGRWSHYDTMHFEYRPELLPPLEPLTPVDDEPPP